VEIVIKKLFLTFLSTILQIGNKRLKVQHKQIHSSDENHDRAGRNAGYDQSGGHQGGGGHYGRGYMPSSLPPSGPMAMNAGWYNNRSAPSGAMESAGTVGSLASDQEPTEEEANPSGSTEDNTGANALSSMDPLLQSLPEVEGNPNN
jgi:hypothetical protein